MPLLYSRRNLCEKFVKLFNALKEDVDINEYLCGNSSCADVDTTIIHNIPVKSLYIKLAHGREEWGAT